MLRREFDDMAGAFPLRAELRFQKTRIHFRDFNVYSTTKKLQEAHLPSPFATISRDCPNTGYRPLDC
jgi:hypothetical protein